MPSSDTFSLLGPGEAGKKQKLNSQVLTEFLTVRLVFEEIDLFRRSSVFQ